MAIISSVGAFRSSRLLNVQMLGGRHNNERFTPHAAQVSLQVGHCQEGQQSERYQIQQGGLSRLEYFGRHGGCQQAQEVANQRAVEIAGNERAEDTV